MAVAFKGKWIEQERDGSWSIYFNGNAYATRSGYKSIEEAKEWIKNNC